MSLQLLVLLTLLLLRGISKLTSPIREHSNLPLSAFPVMQPFQPGRREQPYLFSNELLPLKVLLLLQRCCLAVQVGRAAMVGSHGVGPRLDCHTVVSWRGGHGIGGAWAMWRRRVGVLVLVGTKDWHSGSKQGKHEATEETSAVDKVTLPTIYWEIFLLMQHTFNTSPST